jgi:hypothetical protein
MFETLEFCLGNMPAAADSTDDLYIDLLALGGGWFLCRVI